MPLNGSPSAHIIKPPTVGVDGSVFYEAFYMALARALNLDVASTHIQSVLDESQPRNYLLVARYDRQSGIPVQRLHQEYFCQALGIVSEHK